jgi:hypothetical protein
MKQYPLGSPRLAPNFSHLKQKFAILPIGLNICSSENSVTVGAKFPTYMRLSSLFEGALLEVDGVD